jgi:Cu(I)/Ag(I) efflux system membrane fusion protein
LALEQYETLGKEEKRYEGFLKAAEINSCFTVFTKKQVEQLATAKSVQQRITFLAPASGVIEEIAVAEGQYVNEGDRLYRIENIASLWLEAELYPSETRFVKVGDKISVRVSGFESESIMATVNFLSPEYRANSQITVMRASLNNQGLRFQTRHAGTGILYALIA